LIECDGMNERFDWDGLYGSVEGKNASKGIRKRVCIHFLCAQTGSKVGDLWHKMMMSMNGHWKVKCLFLGYELVTIYLTWDPVFLFLCFKFVVMRERQHKAELELSYSDNRLHVFLLRLFAIRYYHPWPPFWSSLFPTLGYMRTWLLHYLLLFPQHHSIHDPF